MQNHLEPSSGYRYSEKQQFVNCNPTAYSGHLLSLSNYVLVTKITLVN